MKDWKEYRLGEVTTSIQTGPFGSQLHMSDYSDEGIPVVMPKDMLNGKISEISIARVSEEHVNRLSRHKVSDGDILYARRGDIGRCVYISEKENGWLCGTGCLKLEIDRNKADPMFLFLQLQNPSIISLIENRAVGATMPNLNTEILKKVSIKLPPLPTQQKIASILSAYDNLIQNYKKQIEALQTAASELYKEWFVRFRFPGYQTTKFENGIPKGWKVEIFSKYVDVMSGGTPSTEKEEYYNGNIPFFTPKDCDSDFYVFKTQINITEEGLKHCNSHLYPKDTIIITARGTVGNVVLLGIPMAMNQSCFALKSDLLQSPSFLFFAIKTEVMKLKKMANGGVFDTIIVKTFDHIKLTVPNMEIVKNFNIHINPIMNRIYSLQQQITNLTQQRDLLLPRLMSGKLEVK